MRTCNFTLPSLLYKILYTLSFCFNAHTGAFNACLCSFAISFHNVSLSCSSKYRDSFSSNTMAMDFGSSCFFSFCGLRRSALPSVSSLCSFAYCGKSKVFSVSCRTGGGACLCIFASLFGPCCGNKRLCMRNYSSLVLHKDSFFCSWCHSSFFVQHNSL